MSTDSANTAAKWSRYAEQAASDLAENRRRQAELAGHLEELRQEEVLLQSILERAGYSAGTTPRAAGSPRQGGTGNTPVAEPLRPARVDGSAHPGGEGRSEAPAGGAQPLLRDLLLQVLCTHHEPCHARELREELLQRYPDRTPTPQVVRNTLETLVARGRVLRHKDKRSVMYTVTDEARREVDTLRAGQGAL